jgi:hypothetical protein
LPSGADEARPDLTIGLRRDVVIDELAEICEHCRNCRVAWTRHRISGHRLSERQERALSGLSGRQQALLVRGQQRKQIVKPRIKQDLGDVKRAAVGELLERIHAQIPSFGMT